VKQCLDRLEGHGILTKRSKPRKDFDKYKEKMGADLMQKFEHPTYLKEVILYCFNLDLMFVLKARIFKMRQVINEKLATVKQCGPLYKCSNPNCFMSKQQIPEIDASSNNLQCSKCHSKLEKHVQDDELDEKQSTEINQILVGLEEDVKKFQNYRIPSNFFGLGVDFYTRVNPGNLLENLSDVNFIIKCGNTATTNEGGIPVVAISTANQVSNMHNINTN
jgi:hypothetical protein